MKNKSTIKNFGKMLALFRKAKGLTQTDLANAVGVSRRVITYYEAQSQYPPTHILVPIAKTLKVSLDELLGIKKTEVFNSKQASLWRKLKNAEALSKKDKKILLDFIDALLVRSKSANRNK